MTVAEVPADLASSLQQGTLIVVAGAGVTAASVANKEIASWIALLKTGAKRLRELEICTEKKCDVIDSMIDAAQDERDANLLLSAAKTIRDELSSRDRPHFDSFVRDTFKSLEIDNRDLIKAIKKLHCPVATTNYDSVLPEGMSINNIQTWKNKKGMLKILRDNEPGVAYLHGHWEDPDSVVFSSHDYDRLLADEAALFSESSTFLMKNFLFVGMGDGITDPHFDHLTRTIVDKIGVSAINHYLLCKSDNYDFFVKKLSGTPIIPISFGENYSDLPKFLQNLAQRRPRSGSKQAAFAQAANAAWVRVSNEISSNKLHVGESKDTDDVLDTLVTPTFLPLSHEQYVHEKRKAERDAGSEDPSETKLQPIKPQQLLSGQSITLVVAEEHGGLTTTLRWLCLEYANAAGVATIPLVLDRLSMNSNARLATLVKKELQALSLTTKQIDSQPDVVLGIDNVSYRESDRFRNFVNDIARSKAKKIYVGCRLGEESEIVGLLEAFSASVQTVYLGKLGPKDIQKYAVIFSPSVSEVLVQRAQKLITREHLPRNPFTVSLVLALLLQAATRPDRLQSQTDVLNEFMQMLLSYGSGNLDARETLSVSNLERVLTKLARKFVEERSGSLPGSNCVQVLEELFKNLDWDENPTEWLVKLSEMRVLRAEGSQYSFRQSSYLYLYAAKAAVADPEFMNVLLSDPLFFAPIIKHCAALQRDNAELVRATQSLLSKWTCFAHTGSIFSSVPRIGAPDISVVDHGDEVDHDERESLGSDESAALGSEDYEEELANDYDLSNDADVLPFPLNDMQERPAAAQLNVAVNLASTVLRDSDAVEDKDAKDEALLSTLHSWGVLMDLIETDDLVREGARQIVEEGVSQGFYNQEKAEELLPNIHRNYSCLFVYSGISENLRSKKLAPSMERLFKREALIKRGRYAVAAASFLDISSRHKGWSERLVSHTDILGQQWVSTRFITTISRIIYVVENLTATEISNLKTALYKQNSYIYNYRNERHKKLYTDNFIRNLNDFRGKYRARESMLRQRQSVIRRQIN